MERKIKDIFDKHFHEMIRTYVMEEKGVLDLKDFAYDFGEMFIEYFNDKLKEYKEYDGFKVSIDKYKEFIIFSECD